MSPGDDGDDARNDDAGGEPTEEVRQRNAAVRRVGRLPRPVALTHHLRIEEEIPRRDAPRGDDDLHGKIRRDPVPDGPTAPCDGHPRQRNDDGHPGDLRPQPRFVVVLTERIARRVADEFDDEGERGDGERRNRRTERTDACHRCTHGARTQGDDDDVRKEQTLVARLRKQRGRDHRDDHDDERRQRRARAGHRQLRGESRSRAIMSALLRVGTEARRVKTS